MITAVPAAPGAAVKLIDLFGFNEVEPNELSALDRIDTASAFALMHELLLLGAYDDALALVAPLEKRNFEAHPLLKFRFSTEASPLSNLPDSRLVRE